MSELTLFDELERKKILDEADSEDFEEAMDKIKALPLDQWWQLFSKRKYEIQLVKGTFRKLNKKLGREPITEEVAVEAGWNVNIDPKLKRLERVIKGVRKHG